MIDTEALLRGQVREVAPGVWYVPALMANVYFIGERNGPWMMIDAGTPGTAGRLRAAARELFGDGRPSAIVLTHGHFDHVGALEELSREWDVPVFAHPLEFPYLDGRDIYPPPDPTVGGFMAQMSRMFPRKGVQVGERLRPLMMDGTIPYLRGWRYIPTPGHTPGHVSLFRDSDRTLIAGDAIITIDQQNPLKLLSQVREFHGPPQYFTQDWTAAARSIDALAALRPHTVATGHGLPLSGEDVPDLLTRFSQQFQPPAQGRYVENPALADEQGTYYIPPKPRDPVPMYAAGVALAAMGLMFYATRSKKRPSATDEVLSPYRRHSTPTNHM